MRAKINGVELVLEDEKDLDLLCSFLNNKVPPIIRRGKSRRIRSGYKYSKDEILLVKEGMARNISDLTLAKRLGRSPGAIHVLIWKIKHGVI
jgi:hypothetical protein